MASFTDTPLNFNPYIKRIPTDTYAAVGLEKQKEYEIGVDKVQSYIDSIAGLQVIRPQDKQYINAKLGELTTRVNSIASSDWSNQAIVKQVGAMAGSIYNDGKIQSALSGTKRYLKDEQDIEQAKKDGKWAPENEWILRRQMKSWLEDPAIGKEYKTGGYKNYENVNQDIIKMWNDTKPNSRLVQKPTGEFYAYEVGETQTQSADGRTLTETQIKELRPDEIAEQINALITPSQREQLAITGAYNGRGIETSDQMTKAVDSHFKSTESYYDSLIAQANQQKALTGGNVKVNNQIDEQIAQINKKKAELADNKAVYKSQALDNPDAVKSAMYYENWLQGISKHLGYSDVSTKIVDNPAHKAYMDEANLWLNMQKYQLDAKKATMQDARERDLAALRASLKSGKGKATMDSEGNITWEFDSAEALPIKEEERQGVGIQDFKDKLLAINDINQNRTNELLYRFFGDRYVNKATTDLNKDGIIENTYALKPDKRNEANSMVAEWWDKYKRGDESLDPKIKIALGQQDEAKLISGKLAQAVQTVENDADNYIKSNPRYQEYRALKAQMDKFPSIIVNGQTISPTDIQNFRKLDIALNAGAQKRGQSSWSGLQNNTPSIADLRDAKLTPQKYSVIREAMNRQATPVDGQIVGLYDLSNKIAERTGEVDQGRNDYINTQMRRYQGVFNQVAVNVPSGGGEDVSKIANFVQNITATAKETGLEGATDWAAVRKMNGEKHRRETSYNYVQDRDGNVRIRLSNPDVDKGAPQEISIDPETARLSGFYTPDYLGTARSLLDLGEGMKTGTSLEESIPLNNSRTGRYNVRYEVENYNGNYQVNLYVTDTKDKSVDGQRIPISRGLFPDWNSLSTFLTNDVNETFIRGLLNPTAPQPQQSSMFGGSLFKNNPFLQQQTQPVQ